MEKKPVSLKTKLLIGSAVYTLLIAGAFAGLYHIVTRDMNAQNQLIQEKLDQATRRLSSLESQTAALASAPRPDTTALDAARTALDNAQSTISELTTRITSLEKRPLAAPQVSAVSDLVSLQQAVQLGQPYRPLLDRVTQMQTLAPEKIAQLIRFASTGLPSEQQLRQGFIQLLEQSATSQPVNDETLLGRINSHFSGLVTIKKQTEMPGELTALKAQAATAPLEALAESVQKLPAAQQTIFHAWLEQVRARRATLTELDSLTNPVATP